jgi:histidyl-tRNA synthetase
VLDSKRSATREVTDGAPHIVDEIAPESRERFERVLEGLDALGIGYRIEPRLVRGLDYYTHTTFEFQALALESAQNGIGGGGRYDGLAEALGGPPTPGIGFGSGIERILLACDAEGVFDTAEVAPSVFVIDVVDGREARDIVAAARRAGLRADRAYGGRSMKAQMKAADRSGAAVAVIVGQDERAAGEVTLRDLRGDTDQERVPRDAVIDHLRKRL